MSFEEYLKKKNAQKQINKLAKSLKRKKIAIYGAGLFADALFNNYNLSNLNIIAVADKKYNSDSKEKYFNIQTISPNIIKNIDIDVILIATLNTEVILDYLEDELLVNCKNSHVKIMPLIK